MLAVNEYLPVGSVVLLKGGIKKAMIIGIIQMTENSVNTIVEHDYIAVMYPEGFINMETLFMFNHNQITDVIYRGYENPERKEFLEKLEQNVALAKKIIAEQKSSEEQEVNVDEKQVENKREILEKSNKMSSDDIF